MTLNVPSPHELNTSPAPGSKAVASIPFPIGGVATTLPVSASITAIILLWHPWENAPVGCVDRHARRRFARRERPAMLHREPARINVEELARILDVHVDVTCAIRGGEFRFSFQRDSSGHSSSFRIDRRRVGTASVKCEQRFEPES